MRLTYVCGPMSSRPNLNEDEFRAAASVLSRHPNQLDVIVPHDVRPDEHDGPCPVGHPAETSGKHGVACYLRADLRALLSCDEVFVLRGWEASVGARLEVQVAAACGLTLVFQL